LPTLTPNLNLPKPIGTDNNSRANYNALIDAIDQNAAKKTDLNTHTAENTSHVRYGGVTTGTANIYALTLNPAPTLVDGLAVSVKIHVNSTTASTLNVNNLGAIPLKKVNGTDITNLKANGIYTFRYNSTTGNFYVQGEGAYGNATASDLLSGKTASTDAGEITGTIPNRGLGGTVNPSTTDQTKASGYYSSDIVVKGDVDLVASNIKQGVDIFGVVGTVAELKRVSGNIKNTQFQGNPIYIECGFLPKMVHVKGSSLSTSSGSIAESTYSTVLGSAEGVINSSDGTVTSGNIVGSLVISGTGFTIQASTSGQLVSDCPWYAIG
jgi:hypothetical protein